MYQKSMLSDEMLPDAEQAVRRDYGQMLVSVMQALVKRFDSDYPFVNTKLSLLTGDDFDVSDPVRGRNAVYGWIQGRGLEALAGHCAWFQKQGIETQLVADLNAMMRVVLEKVHNIWQKNGERLWFFMLPNGQPFVLGDDGQPAPFDMGPNVPYGFSDLFASKGMYAAACYLGDERLKADALRYIEAVDASIWSGKFANDQVTLDPKNPVMPVPGRLMQGPFMIQIGTAAMLVLQGDWRGFEMGIRLIDHELTHYVNLGGRVAALQEGDMWEANGMDGLPYRETSGAVVSDPGHALEFVGLALKFTQAASASPFVTQEQREQIAQMEAVMPLILRKNFENGFLGNGICKAFDLTSRKALNTDLPWWNLPETMRAAVFCKQMGSETSDVAFCHQVLRQCHNAFVRYFVRTDLHLMAYQTITAQGDPVDVIPATADADPGYHTGLSIIDVLDAVW